MSPPEGSKINVNFINPFLESTVRVVGTQCKVTVTPGKPFVWKGPPAEKADEIAGMIQLESPGFKGKIFLIFPHETFLLLMSRMLDSTFTVISEENQDGAGELLNMVYGHAKSALNKGGMQLQMAIPKVVRSPFWIGANPAQLAGIVLPIESEVGPFRIEIIADKTAA